MVLLCLEHTILSSLLVQERTWYQALCRVCAYSYWSFKILLNDVSWCLKCTLRSSTAAAFQVYLLTILPDYFSFFEIKVCSRLAPASVELLMMLLATSRMLTTEDCHLMSLSRAWRRRAFGFLELATGIAPLIWFCPLLFCEEFDFFSQPIWATENFGTSFLQ